LKRILNQLENELQSNSSVDIAIFPEGYLNENVKQACYFAKRYSTILIGGYKRLQDTSKNRVIIINRSGHIVLDRVKYSQTSFVVEEGLKIGHILCDELIKQGVNNEDTRNIDLIVHPIGVGMFSEEQCTSHADGSFRGSDISIPIAYCMDKNGEALFISKNDVRTRILDTKTNEVSFPQKSNY
jgi:hypothetical protein